MKSWVRKVFGRGEMESPLALPEKVEVREVGVGAAARGYGSDLLGGAWGSSSGGKYSIETIRNALLLDPTLKAAEMALRLPLHQAEAILTGEKEQVAWLEEMLERPPTAGGPERSIQEALEDLALGVRDGHSDLEMVFGQGAKGEVLLRDLAYRPATHVRYRVDERGRLKSVVQRHPSTGEELEIPAWKVLHFDVNGDQNPFYGISHFHAATRVVHEKWKVQVFARLQAMQQGVPPKKASYPMAGLRGRDPKEVVKELEEMLAKAAGAGGTIITPNDYTVEMMKGGGDLDLMPLIRHYDDAILMSVLAGFQSQGGEGRGGARAAAEVQSGLFFLMLQGFYQIMERVLNRGLIPALVNFNGRQSLGYPRYGLEALDSDRTRLAEALLEKVTSAPDTGLDPMLVLELEEWFAKRMRFKRLSYDERAGQIEADLEVVREKAVVDLDVRKAELEIRENIARRNGESAEPQSAQRARRDDLIARGRLVFHDVLRRGNDWRDRFGPLPEGSEVRFNADRPGSAFVREVSEEEAREHRDGLQVLAERVTRPVVEAFFSRWEGVVVDALREKEGELEAGIQRILDKEGEGLSQRRRGAEAFAGEAATEVSALVADVLGEVRMSLLVPEERAIFDALVSVFELGASGKIDEMFGVGASGGFALTDPSVLASIEENLSLMSGVADEAMGVMRGGLARAIQDGITEGKNPLTIARSLRGMVPGMTKGQSEKTARTEAGRELNRAGGMAIERSGAAGAEWICALKEASRPGHVNAHGSQRFAPPEGDWTYPNGDRFPGESSPYNCICTEKGIFRDGDEGVVWDGGEEEAA